MQIKRFIFFICATAAVVVPYNSTLSDFSADTHKPFILILDPAGDAQHTGRHIDDVFERGITLQCAEKIKQELAQRAPWIKVFITRLPGDIVYELQNASFANRINADLLISINFYRTQETKPTLYIYQFSCGNDFVQIPHNLYFLPYHDAYLVNKKQTDHIVTLFAQELAQQLYQPLFTVSGPHAIPSKQLVGIIAPCMVIEAGIKDKNSWGCYIDPLISTILVATTRHRAIV